LSGNRCGKPAVISSDYIEYLNVGWALVEVWFLL